MKSGKRHFCSIFFFGNAIEMITDVIKWQKYCYIPTSQYYNYRYHSFRIEFMYVRDTNKCLWNIIGLIKASRLSSSLKGIWNGKMLIYNIQKTHIQPLCTHIEKPTREKKVLYNKIRTNSDNWFEVYLCMKSKVFYKVFQGVAPMCINQWSMTTISN